MSANKEIVRAALQHLGDRNVPALAELIHEEGSWSIPYNSERFPFAGFKAKPAVVELLTGFLGQFSSFSFNILSLTGDEDRVVAEAESQGVGPGGAQYSNRYLMFFQLKDGKLHTVREYLDPFQVHVYLEQLPQPAA